MNLKQITIKNFRSIKEQILEIKHNCIILVGKNEAGKTDMQNPNWNFTTIVVILINLKLAKI